MLITFLLNRAFPEAPFTAKIFSTDGNIRIRLRKYTRIRLPNRLLGKEVESLDNIVGRAEIEEVKSGKEGNYFIHVVIGAGERGVKRVGLHPNCVTCRLAAHIPAFYIGVPTMQQYRIMHCCQRVCSCFRG